MLVTGDSKKGGSQQSKHIKNRDTDFSHVNTSNLYLIQVPKSYDGKRYSKLFDELTTRRFMIPLGLYRAIEVNLRVYNEPNIGFKKPGLTGNGPETILTRNKKDDVLKLINYVVTNPESDTRI